ncbi:hypothetical protein [Chondromyces apiculatus]|uniref:Cytochrome P460 domain-containing protein n=1 Tax=Chondromyces apiculatus DSM 436 TaxID=1192034 RepID=A0A017TEC9_9BACT|nr:hypothetical protein [Chondromyces apiculatus]EYF06961.1 Hypothetical protein CAP_1220 [Chondromyces apiculatus DSM 436]
MSAALLFVVLAACGSSDDGEGGAPASGGGGQGGSGHGGAHHGHGGEGGSGGDGGSGGGVSADDLDMAAADFDCILGWDKVRKFRVSNRLGRQEEALAVANSPDGGVYPVGTVLQLVPTEAMVKRRAGFDATTRDWEFFSLEVSASGTTILARGAAETVNAFGGNCFDCHALAQPQWDLICEDTHGCDPIPLSAEQIQQIQDGDPRCAP